MKKLLLTALLAFSVNAEYTTAESEFCDKVEEMAKVIMKSRQAGTSMGAMIKRANGNTVIITVIESAYNEPRWSSPEMVERAIADFKNSAYQICYDNFKG